MLILKRWPEEQHLLQQHTAWGQWAPRSALPLSCSSQRMPNLSLSLSLSFPCRCHLHAPPPPHLVPASRCHLLSLASKHHLHTHWPSAPFQLLDAIFKFSLCVLQRATISGGELTHDWCPRPCSCRWGTPGPGGSGGRVTCQSPRLGQSERWFSADCQPQGSAQAAEQIS